MNSPNQADSQTPISSTSNKKVGFLGPQLQTKKITSTFEKPSNAFPLLGTIKGEGKKAYTAFLSSDDLFNFENRLRVVVETELLTPY